LFIVQLNAELKNLTNQNNEILHEINRCDNDLQKYDEKLQILDNMTHLATQSLEVYFQTVGKSFNQFSYSYFLKSVWKIYIHSSMNNVGLFPMVYKKKLIIGKKFMLCYNSKERHRKVYLSDGFAFFNRKLVVPGDLRSYGGGNGLPRGVKQSPDFSRIVEEDEEEETEEEEEKKNDVSMILVKSI
jgi:hypothetical protein